MVAKFQICYSLFLQGHHLFHATNHHLFKHKKMPIRRTQERGFSTKEKRFGVREKAVSRFRPQTASLVQGGMKLSATNSASDRRLYAASGDDLRFWWKAVSGVGPERNLVHRETTALVSERQGGMRRSVSGNG
jgi:hypothetical protein